MAGVTRSLATLTVTLSGALVSLALWCSPPAAAQEAGEAERIVEEGYDGCTFRLINHYSTDGRAQYARTRQVWSPDCTFGSRNWSIRVRVCFEVPEAETPVNCSDWLMPTAQTAFAEAEITGEPLGSIHYVEIRGSVRRFTVPPPEPASPAPTGQTTGDASPASGPSGAPDAAPERTNPDRGRPDTRYGLAAALAAGGMALLGLGGTAVWFLRRGAAGPG